MAIQANSGNQSGPDLKSLGFNSPMEVIDLLACMEFRDDSGVKFVINDDKAFLNPQMKAEQVVKFYKENFNINPGDLPQLASIMKQDLKAGKLKMGGIY